MDNGNRRNSRVYLTEVGKKYVSRLVKEFAQIESQALTGFTEDEKELLQDFLDRVYKNMIDRRECVKK